VEFSGVSLHFADKPIFVDLNLTIRSGECLVLLGPSGGMKKRIAVARALVLNRICSFLMNRRRVLIRLRPVKSPLISTKRLPSLSLW
jgi:ABC-type transporter Mla maintaining outer membrane lipid asymmetry ATPase subunit MlaF